MPSRDTRSAFLQGVRQLELQLGAFVEDNAYQVLEGLGVDESSSTIDDGSVAFDLDEADGLTRLTLQIPVGERDLTPPFPAAHSFIGLLVLPPAKEHGGSQDILGHATEEQHKQSHLVAASQAIHRADDRDDEPEDEADRTVAGVEGILLCFPTQEDLFANGRPVAYHRVDSRPGAGRAGPCWPASGFPRIRLRRTL